MSQEEALTYCLENPDSLSMEQMLDRFPQYREELESLLTLHGRVARVLPQTLSPERRAAMKSRLITAADNRQSTPSLSIRSNRSNGHVAASPTYRAADHAAPMLPRQRSLPGSRRAGWMVAALAGVLGLVWFLSSSAMPDSPFYSAKLATEDVLLNFAGGPSAQVNEDLDLANTRLRDLRTMFLAGKLAQSGSALDSYDRHLDRAGSVWHALQTTERVEVGRLLYVSTVAGQNTFAAFRSTVKQLPPAVESAFSRATNSLDALGASSSQALRDAGVDPDEVLQSAGPQVSAMLTPLPGSVLSVPSSTAGSVGVPSTVVGTPGRADIAGTQTVVLYLAQTVVAAGGSDDTPVVPAAIIVLQGTPGTPLAHAQETIAAANFPSTPTSPPDETVVVPVVPTVRPLVIATVLPATPSP